jgi:alkylhydroperoxidase/carboxymuconolactone decarboxylase family protein YurZ
MATDTLRYQEALRRLALNDDEFIASTLARYSSASTSARSGPGGRVIDDRTRRLIDVAVRIALGGGQAGISAAVDAALGAGADPDEVVEVLLAITPAVGTGRAVDCAPLVATAIGYDIDADLEAL